MSRMHVVHLPDGRKLGYSLYGDLKGKPLFYFHGWPSSRLGAQNYDSLAKKLHIRIIAPDRPGYGVSDYKKGRRLLDWSDDVTELADTLEIKKFAVMGVSGGGPYAAVCAYRIPERLTKVGIVVGLAPIIGPEILQGQMWISKFGWLYGGKFPFLCLIPTFIQYMYARMSPSWGFHRFLFGAKTDRKFYSNPATRRAMKKNFREAYRQGMKGAELDLQLYTADWRFEVKNIAKHTYLWYGTDDRNVPVGMGKYYASHIAKNTFTEYSGEGHFVSITHAEEILKTLAQ